VDDYSEELGCLKNKIMEIEWLAQQEIVRLKEELARERAKNSQKTPRVMQMVEVGINTERDLRDDEISMLKESILRHISLNRQLLLRELPRQAVSSEPMQNLLSKI
jgi:hypothetical protein